MSFIKNISYLLLLMAVMSLWFTHWAISNIFEINPNVATWKYYCNTTFTTDIDYVSDVYSSFEFNIKFDTWALTLSHNSTNPDFTNDLSNNITNNNYY